MKTAQPNETTPLIPTQSTEDTLITLQNKIEATEETFDEKTACFRDFCDRFGLSLSITFVISGVILDAGAILAAMYLPPVNPIYYKLSIFFGSITGVAGTGGLANEVVKLKPKPSASLQSV